jgi:enolase
VGRKITSDEQIDYLEMLVSRYPIDSIEDGMSEMTGMAGEN